MIAVNHAHGALIDTKHPVNSNGYGEVSETVVKDLHRQWMEAWKRFHHDSALHVVHMASWDASYFVVGEANRLKMMIRYTGEV